MNINMLPSNKKADNIDQTGWLLHKWPGNDAKHYGTHVKCIRRAQPFALMITKFVFLLMTHRYPIQKAMP